MTKRGTVLVWGLAATVLAPAGLTGQVVPAADGRALDANPLVGGTGYNTPVSADPQLSSQLYITGQVTGLGRFHGRSVYYAEDQLHLSLPSAGISRFLQSSVGLPDVLGGTPYIAAPYYDRAATILRAGDLASGRSVLPGAAPAGAAGGPYAPLDQQLLVDALVQYESLSPLAVNRVWLAEQVLSGLGAAQRTAGGAAPRAGRPAQEGPVPAAGAAGLFAIPRGADQLDLARELYQEHLREQGAERQIQAEVRAQPAGAAGEDRGGEPAGPEAKASSQKGLTRGGIIGRTREGQGGQGPGQAGAKTPDGQIPYNQDVFLDMLLRLRQRQSGTGQAAAEPPGQAPSVPKVRQGPGTGPPGAAGGGPVELTEDRSIVLHGLAGQARDPLNVQMARAEKELAAGQYYGASDVYQAASLANPYNPLPRVGMSLSLLGAGEPLSAGVQLRNALVLFPPMMEMKVDLGNLMKAEAAKVALEGLDARLQDATPQNKAMLHLVATFIYKNTGELSRAAEHAGKLKSLAGDDPHLAAYAEFVLTGRRPREGQGPTTSPVRPSP